ncbi:MAG: magnesium-translocating P-type ATPase [Candidatus Micrarchaeia archaeon]
MACVEASLFAKPADEVLAELHSTPAGLSSHEVALRLRKWGRNEVERWRRKPALEILLSQFTSPLVVILFVAAAIAGFLGELTESAIIIAILLINAVLGFLQELKSERALEKLARYLPIRAKVIRDGRRVEINAAELVPGDIVELAMGDIVPADVRLISALALATDESVLTGESAPVEKSASPVKVEKPIIQELRNIAFAGTHVASGSGIGVVIATGRHTELGRTAAFLKARPPPTDFERSMRAFGDMFLAVIVIMTVFIFAINTMLGKDPLLSLLFALAIAVGITPEMLPMIITLTLSSGALVLAAKKVVVKRLESIEDLGDMDVLCTDKTGTLTENKLTLERHVNVAGEKDERVLLYALLCSPVAAGRHRLAGTPFDVALWEHAGRMSFAHRLKEYATVEVIPFDFERRRMSVVVEDSAGRRHLYCKGSVEKVLAACTTACIGKRLVGIEAYRKKVMKEYEELSAQGYRVLALAGKAIAKKRYSPSDEQGLALYGLLVFSDPPKKSATAAIQRLAALGVELKILSGDNPLVTAQVCREVGLEIKGGRVITGAEYASLTRRERAKVVEDFNVFARLTPAQKHEIITLLKEGGHITGYIGDGVNDAPALHVSDVGISVDSGVDIAKEAADIVLLKKDLTVIADGIAEGRKTFNNTAKYIFNTISANFGNMLTLSLASLFLAFIPLLPTQILLVNFISDFPLMAIPTDRVDDDDLRKPKRWNIGIITRFMIFFGLISSIFDFIMIYFLIAIANAPPALFRTGWFLFSVITEVIATFALRTKKAFFRSRPSELLLTTSCLTVLGSVALLYSPLAAPFELVPLDKDFLAVVLAVIAAYFAIVELAKHIFFRHYRI